MRNKREENLYALNALTVTIFWVRVFSAFLFIFWFLFIFINTSQMHKSDVLNYFCWPEKSFSRKLDTSGNWCEKIIFLEIWWRPKEGVGIMNMHELFFPHFVNQSECGIESRHNCNTWNGIFYKIYGIKVRVAHAKCATFDILWNKIARPHRKPFGLFYMLDKCFFRYYFYP